MPGLRVFKILMFVAGTAAWWVAGQPFIASVFGVLAGINLLAAWAFKQV